MINILYYVLFHQWHYLSIIFNNGTNRKSVKDTKLHQKKKSHQHYSRHFLFHNRRINRIQSHIKLKTLVLGSLGAYEFISALKPRFALSLYPIFPFSFPPPRAIFSLLCSWSVQLFTLICLMSLEFHHLPNSLELVIQQQWSRKRKLQICCKKILYLNAP